MSNLISNVEYATFANYSPHGTSDLSKKSRNTCYKFKNGNVGVIELLVQEIRGLEESGIFGEFFGPTVTLVPAPRSSLLVAGGLWPSKLIADAFKDAGIVKDVKPFIERIEPVVKSSTAPPGHRPTVKIHHKSLRVANPEIFKPERITLIDDVLTKGCTVFACVVRLREAFPDIPIRVFTPMRTQGLIPNIERIKDPSVGEITYNPANGEVHREP